jgi:hypothetical protein
LLVQLPKVRAAERLGGSRSSPGRDSSIAFAYLKRSWTHLKRWCENSTALIGHIGPKKVEIALGLYAAYCLSSTNRFTPAKAWSINWFGDPHAGIVPAGADRAFEEMF